MPFMFFAGLYLVTYPLISSILISSNSKIQEQQRMLSDGEDSSESKKGIPLMILLRKPRFVFGVMA